MLSTVFVLFVRFSLFESTKCKKKCFMIKFYIPHSENIYRFQNTTLNILPTVAKTCKKVLRLNMTSTTNLKVEHFHS